MASGLGCPGRQRYCNSCAVAKRADQLRADAAAKVILEQARKLKTENPAEWEEKTAAAEAGSALSDTEALELLRAIDYAEVEALRRMVEGET